MAQRTRWPPPWKWRRLLLIGSAVLCVGYLGLTLVLSRFLDPEALADWLEPRIEAAINRQVEIGRVEVGFFPLSVDLLGLSVADPTGLAPVLARIDVASFQVAMLPLLRKRVDVRRLVLGTIEAHLRIGPDGRSNFGDFSVTPDEPSPAEGPTRETSLELDLRSVHLFDGRIQYRNDRDSTGFDVSDVRTVASVRTAGDGGWAVRSTSSGRISSGAVHSPIPIRGIEVEVRGNLTADPEFQTLAVREAEISLGRIGIEVAGTVEHLKEPVRTLGIRVRDRSLQLDDAFDLLPDSILEQLGGMPSGVVSLDLEVNGDLGPETRPELFGEVVLQDGRFTNENGIVLAEAMEGSVRLAGARSAEIDLQGRSLEGPFSLAGTVELHDMGAFDLDLVASPSLAGLHDFGSLPPGVTVAGKIETRVGVRGRIDDLRRISLSGEALPTRVRFTHPSLGVRVEIPGGRIRLNGKRALTQGLPLLLGDDRLSLSGELRDLTAVLDPDRIAAGWISLTGPRLDLREVSGRSPPDSALTYGRVAFARLGGRHLAGRSPEAAATELGLRRPDSIPFSGIVQIALDTLIARTGRSEQLRMRLELAPTSIRILEASYQRFGGEVRATGALSLAPGAESSFTFSMQVEDTDAGAFLSSSTPIGNLVRGRLSITTDFVGSLDEVLLPYPTTLAGSGIVSLQEGRVASTPLTNGLASFLALEGLREPALRSWVAPFLVEAGTISIGEAMVEGAPGEPSIGGTIGLNGALDLLSVFDLPSERLNVGVMERLEVPGSVVEELRTRGEAVQAVLHIGGSLLAPEIRPVSPVQSPALGEAIQERAREEAQERMDEQRERFRERAAGVLRGLLRRQDPQAQTEVRDTLREGPVPGDSVWADMLREDSIRIDSVPEDTLRPDTLPPDTLDPDILIPDTLLPETTEPDTTRPDTTRHDTMAPGTIRPDTLAPDTLQPAGEAFEVTRPNALRAPTPQPIRTFPVSIPRRPVLASY